MALPTMATGKVVGQFLVGDGTTAAVQAAQGIVIFTAAVPTVPNPSGGFTLVNYEIVGVLDEEGWVCTPLAADPTKPGTRGVNLAATDAAGVGVNEWTWTISSRFEALPGSRIVPHIIPFDFDVHAGKTEDLAKVAKVPNSTGTGNDFILVLAREEAKAAAEPAARAAVAAALTAEGVMRGRVSIGGAVADDTVWRQTTESGHYLPLGYNAEGRLDSFARQIWREDVNRTEEMAPHPLYARAQVTENGELLYALRWDGTVEIPGLAATAAAAAPALYNDAPYVPGSEVRPAMADRKAWAVWGSSSAAGIGPHLRTLATAAGATLTTGGQSGERSSHIAARLGSVPAKLRFPSNTVPASGAVGVTSVTFGTGNASLKTYTGTLKALDGSTIAGTLSSDSAGALTFTRTGSGSALNVAQDTAFIPDLGTARRADTTFLWMGKNNTNEPERVIRETDASFEYLVPLVKRCMVLGHFVDTNISAGSATRANINTINAAHAARYGAAFLDVSAYLTGAQVWTDTGITPTAEDTAQQALGNKPPSLSSDAGHLNTAGNTAVRKLIETRMTELGWL